MPESRLGYQRCSRSSREKNTENGQRRLAFYDDYRDLCRQAQQEIQEQTQEETKPFKRRRYERRQSPKLEEERDNYSFKKRSFRRRWKSNLLSIAIRFPERGYLEDINHNFNAFYTRRNYLYQSARNKEVARAIARRLYCCLLIYGINSGIPVSLERKLAEPDIRKINLAFNNFHSAKNPENLHELVFQTLNFASSRRESENDFYKILNISLRYYFGELKKRYGERPYPSSICKENS